MGPHRILVVLSSAIVMLAVACGGGSGSTSSSATTPPPVTDQQFTIVVLPDTQCYTSGGEPSDPSACNKTGSMDMFNTQMQWIVANKGAGKQSILAVLGLGDIVECGDSLQQWTLARNAYDLIDNAGLPYAPAMGNRDYDNSCSGGGLSTRLSSNFNTYFGPSKFSGKSWYSATSYPASSNENFYITFSAQGQEYILLNLEFFARDAAVAWGSSVIDAHPNAQFIVVTNGFLNAQGAHMLDNDPGGPAQYGLGGDRGNNGQELWDGLLKTKANIIGVLSSEAGGTQRRSDVGVNGNRVPQMQVNFQNSGGQGYLRILAFSPAQKTISVQTYSPFLQKFHTEDAHHFTVQYGK